MEIQGDWADRFAGEISGASDHFSLSERKRYKLPLLLSLAQRVAGFSSGCEVCQDMQNQIVSLGTSLADTPQLTGEKLKGYLNIIKGITRHLKRRHGLAEERQYVKRYVLLSTGAGLSLVMLGLALVSFGIVLLSLNITLPALVTRVIFAYTFGHFRDRRARRQGRVI